MFEELLARDAVDQLGVKAQDTVKAQNVRNEVVGKHREAREVVEFGDAGAGQVGGGDLGALEERELDVAVARAVGERRPASQAPREAYGRAAGGVGNGGE